MPEFLRGRAVIHFIDNTAALSALVHGYAGKPDMARLVNAFHAQVVGLRCMTWKEWVPSKANPSDIPTRTKREGEMPKSAIRVRMILPPVEIIKGNVAGWIQRVRTGTG
jgi:hypothetical protein